MQHDLSREHLDTTVRSMETEVPLDADGYGREESDDSCRSRVIVHGRRSQRVVQGDLEDRKGDLTTKPHRSVADQILDAVALEVASAQEAPELAPF